MALTGVILFCKGAVAQSSSKSESTSTDLFNRAAELIRGSSATVYRLTCAAEIRRSEYEPVDVPGDHIAEFLQAAQPPVDAGIWKDAIHLDISVFQGVEFFSWPDHSRFTFNDLHEYFKEGASLSGEFGVFAESVFLRDVDRTSLSFSGIEKSGNKRLARFTYRVPLNRSHLVIRTSSDVIVPYEGYFLLQPESGNLIRLAVFVKTPATKSDVRFVSILTDYGMTRVGQGTALLPQSSTVRLLTSTGALQINDTTFSSCRIFTADSKIDSGPLPALSAPSLTVGIEPSRVPAGLHVIAKVLKGINSEKTSVGTPVNLEVMRDVKIDGDVVLRRRSLISGVVVRTMQASTPSARTGISIIFSKVRDGRETRPISLGSLGPQPEQMSEYRVTVEPQWPPDQPHAASENPHVATITCMTTGPCGISSGSPWWWRTE